MIISVTNMTKLYKIPIIKHVAKRINLLLGCDIPTTVTLGNNVDFIHNMVGGAIHQSSIIGDNVRIFQGVTIGIGRVYSEPDKKKCEGCIIEDGAVLCAGAKILCNEGRLVVGRKSVIAANAVLLNSTGPGEIWGGVPAKLIGHIEEGE